MHFTVIVLGVIMWFHSLCCTTFREIWSFWYDRKVTQLQKRECLLGLQNYVAEEKMLFFWAQVRMKFGTFSSLTLTFISALKLWLWDYYRHVGALSTILEATRVMNIERSPPLHHCRRFLSETTYCYDLGYWKWSIVSSCPLNKAGKNFKCLVLPMRSIDEYQLSET